MRLFFAPCLCAALFAQDPVRITWHDKQPMSEGVSGGAVAILGGKLIYSGGTTWRNEVKCWLDDTRVYDLESRTWSGGPSLPEHLAYGAYLHDRSSLEVLGGMSEGGMSRKCWRLNAGEHAWTLSGELPQSSIFGKAATVHGQAYLFGGCANLELSSCSNSVMRRSDSGMWEKVSELPHGAVAIASVAVVRDQVYFFGGCSARSSGGVRNRNEAYRFDPRTNQWTALRSTPAAARGMSAVALDERYILLAGGYTDSPTGFSSAAYLYDVEAGQYKKISPLPIPVMGMEMLSRGKTIWGAGGEDRSRGRTQRLIEGMFVE